MSSTQPGSPTPPPSASLEERIRETERRGSEMEGRRGSRENTGLFFIFYTPSFSAWLSSCYNVKLAFLSVYREQCGTVTWSRRGEGNDFGGGCMKEAGERWRRGATG